MSCGKVQEIIATGDAADDESMRDGRIDPLVQILILLTCFYSTQLVMHPL